MSHIRIRSRLSLLVIFLWMVLACFSGLFVQYVFGLTPEQSTTFIRIFLVAWLIALVLSVAAVRVLLQPLEDFIGAHRADRPVPDDVLDRAVRSTSRLFPRLGLVGLVLPLLWLAATGLFLGLFTEGLRSHLPFFVILGVFDAMFLGSILFLVPQVWSYKALELLSDYRGDVLSGQGISLKWKIRILGFMLATIPTLLVGAMSFNIADRLLDEEAGRGLQEKLARANDEVGAMLRNGLGRMEVERHLGRIATLIGEDSFVHLGLTSGEFYRSEDAGSLAPELYGRIRDLWTDDGSGEPVSGNIVDSESGLAYSYAFSRDGSMVSIAPVIHASRQTINTLMLLIVVVWVCSTVVATIVGYTFATNMGHKIQRMTVLTGEIARGELTREVRLLSDDELGKLGANLGIMTDNLRRMVRGVNAVSGQISTTCSQLLVKASAISTGAEIQSRSVGETFDSVEELDSNIQAASDSLQALVESSQETAEAANKVSESFNLMLMEAGGLQQTIERTGSIVSEMAASIGEVADNIKDLSDGAGRSAVSMAEMDGSISAVTTSASDTARIARQAIKAAQEGALAVRRTIEGMDRIVESTRKASDVIVGLGNRVEDIGSILGVIEEIADQTNLLALNAAIIAAQAGEHGRSFAVVADEIRSLAERTATPTREIAQMISDIQEASGEASEVMRGGVGIVNEGVALARQAGDSLNQILASVQKAADNVDEIAINTEGQAKASEIVTREIARVADMASRISRAAAEQARAGEQLQQAFQETLSSGESLDGQLNQQAQENRQAMAAVSATNEAAARASKAMIGQSAVSEGILKAIEQVREIAKNHAIAATEMGEATQALAEKSASLKEEIGGFNV